MRKKIILAGREVAYTLRRRRGVRRMSLSINCDAVVSLTAPRWAPNYLLEKFILDKASWILERMEWFKKNTVGKIKNKGTHRDYLLNKKAAYFLAKNKLEEFNRLYNFSYQKVCVRNQKSRWGSCSARGTLSFSYRIALLPEPLAEYIIVHELCHLKEMNHSVRFWAQVARAVPDFRQRRRELKKMGNNV